MRVFLARVNYLASQAIGHAETAQAWMYWTHRQKPPIWKVFFTGACLR